MKTPSRKEYHRGYHIANRERINERTRRHHFKYRYNITKEEAADLVKQCCGKCQICGVLLSKNNPPHIDHNHKNGEVRGVLCRCCNSGLGLFRDDPKILQKATEYLQ
jgi:hypothetical protein